MNRILSRLGIGLLFFSISSCYSKSHLSKKIISIKHFSTAELMVGMYDYLDTIETPRYEYTILSFINDTIYLSIFNGEEQKPNIQTIENHIRLEPEIIFTTTISIKQNHIVLNFKSFKLECTFNKKEYKNCLLCDKIKGKQRQKNIPFCNLNNSNNYE